MAGIWSLFQLFPEIISGCFFISSHRKDLEFSKFSIWKRKKCDLHGKRLLFRSASKKPAWLFSSPYWPWLCLGQYVGSESNCWYFLGLEKWGLFICILWSDCFSSASLFLLSGSCTVFPAPTHTDPTLPVLSAPRDTLVSDSAALRGKFLQFWDQLNVCSVANYFCERFGFLYSYNPSFTRKHSEVIKAGPPSWGYFSHLWS